MTQTQYTKAILKEIQKLNKKIDAKILKGEKYNNESLKHKTLLMKIQEQRQSSILNRLFLSY